MLRNAPIRACIPVSDVARARKFYEQTIGYPFFTSIATRPPAVLV